MIRVAANDPAALCDYACDLVGEGNYDDAFKCWKRAAESGDANAHYEISLLYSKGRGVEKDEKKEVYHWKRQLLQVIPGLDTILHIVS